MHLSVHRGEEKEIRILIVTVFLQACNVIKGITDLAFISPCGCYLFLQLDEKSLFCG